MPSARAKELFLDALTRPAEVRSAFVIQACADNATLQSEVEDLLKVHDEAGRFLNPTAADDLAKATRIAPGSRVARDEAKTQGSVIGRYKLLQQLGEGGFGSVWMAEQREPVVRKVALKIIKLGMDTRQVIARFEAERQALALMDHPNIAKVFDAGATDTGRPYFVMELCTGDSITRFCDKHNLSIDERLDLFAQVCMAVQHAHQKGLIHRDLKPSNILVATQDGRPHAKVIDFGIAKATASRLTEMTLFTEHRQMIGTPAYMSPEQAEGSLDIDTRTDVYSLGVLLYELLTGTTPFSDQELRSAAYAEIQRIIREVEPPRPSTRLSQKSETIATVAAARQTVPRKLGLVVRGELDWIVMKALEKDRARRYETANGLALDIRRYLSGEPVVAAPPSAAYRLRKFIRRNRTLVTAGTIVALTLVLGVIGTTWGLFRALNEKQRADVAAAAEHLAQQESMARAEALEKVAGFQSAQLSNVDVMQMGIRFRRDLLNSLRQAGERTHVSAATTEARIAATDEALTNADLTALARSALENSLFQPSIEAIHAQFADQPDVRADLLLSVSESARRLGAFDVAESPGREALEIRTANLGPTAAKTLEARMRQGLLLKDRGQLSEAEAKLRECLSVALVAHGNDAKITMDLRSNLAAILTARTQYQEAAELYGLALPWHREHTGPLSEDTLGSMSSLASTLGNLERFDEAEPLFHESLAGFRTAFGTSNLRTIQALNNLAGFYRAKKDYPQARQTYDEALQAAREALGEDHWLTLMITDNIGGVLYAEKDTDGAIRFARQAFEGRQRVLGPNHAATLRSCFNLASVLESQGQADEATVLYRRAVEGFQQVYGEFHSFTIRARTSLSGVLIKGEKFKECADLLLAENAMLEGASEAPPDRRRAVIRALGILYEKWAAAQPGQGYDVKAAEWNTKLEQLPAPPASAPATKPSK